MTVVTTHTWRRSTSRWPVWHLMRADDLERAYCGRHPHGAWKSTDGALYPWPDRSCFSCMDIECGNFPQRETVDEE